MVEDRNIHSFTLTCKKVWRQLGLDLASSCHNNDSYAEVESVILYSFMFSRKPANLNHILNVLIYQDLSVKIFI